MDTPARIPIGSWPTPVRRLDGVSEHLGTEVWAKLEEECGAWGGNKVRKLEYILGRARAEGVSKLVGYGAGTSNWTSALALHGRSLGFAVEVVLSGNPVPPEYSRLYAGLGTRVREVNRIRFAAEVAGAMLRADRGATRHLPPGGTGIPGDLGSVHGGREIAASIDSGELPRPRLTFIATGTAGTAAGISAGAALAGHALDIVCVRVTQKPFGTPRRVAKRTRRLAAEPRVGALLADDRFFAPGYGEPNAAGLEAAEVAELDGLELDQVYAAKAFASLIAHARCGHDGPLLFLHTSPGAVPTVS